MSDSTANLDQVLPSQAQKEASVNALLDAASPATIFGRRASSSALLSFGYYGGRLGGTTAANGAVSVTASTTNYIVAHRSTLAVTVATTTTNWNDTTTYGRMYLVVAGASSITSYQDHRMGSSGILTPSSSFAGGTLTSALNEAPIVTLASAGTVNIGAAAANTISITGTTTITAFDTIASGAIRRLIFAGILTFTHNGTSLILPTGASITTAVGDVAELVSLGSGNWRCTNYERSSGVALAGSGSPKVIQVACSDQGTAITTGTAKVTFRMPYAMTLTAVRASLNTSSSSGLPTIDINEAGTTILSTKITIDATELTSTTAATAAVISDTSLADDAEITIDIDVAGTGAKGLVVTLIGT